MGRPVKSIRPLAVGFFVRAMLRLIDGSAFTADERAIGRRYETGAVATTFEGRGRSSFR